jgi:hypothetical protein
MAVKLVARLFGKDPCRRDFPGNCARMLPRDLLRGGQCLSIVAGCDYVDAACRGFVALCPEFVPQHCDMSAAIWPPIGDAQLADEQAASQARELEWLLVQLRETLQSLKAGLEECAALLAPSENGSTLVLSSLRSESLKGLITRVGTRVTKGVRPPSRCPASCVLLTRTTRT